MSTIKNLMKMAYIDQITAFNAININIGVNTHNIMSLDIEALGILKSLVEKERRFNIKSLHDGNIKINFGDTYQNVISLDDVMIDDEAVFRIDKHCIWFRFYLDESILMSVTVTPEEAQLTDIYTRLQEFQNDINALSGSSFVYADSGSTVLFNLA